MLLVSAATHAFASSPTSFIGDCEVDINGSTVLTSNFNLKTKEARTLDPIFEDLDINVPDCEGVYTKFTLQARVRSTPRRTTADFSLVSKGDRVASAFMENVKRGTVITFESKLLENSRVSCIGTVL